MDMELGADQPLQVPPEVAAVIEMMKAHIVPVVAHDFATGPVMQQLDRRGMSFARTQDGNSSGGYSAGWHAIVADALARVGASGLPAVYELRARRAHNTPEDQARDLAHMIRHMRLHSQPETPVLIPPVTLAGAPALPNTPAPAGARVVTAPLPPPIPPNVDHQIDDDDDEDGCDGECSYGDCDSCDEYHEEHYVRTGCCGCCEGCDLVHTDFRSSGYTREISVQIGTRTGSAFYCTECDHQCHANED